MKSKTKIIVLHMKEILYTAIFLALAILLAFLLFSMFQPKETTTTPSTEEHCISSFVDHDPLTL